VGGHTKTPNEIEDTTEQRRIRKTPTTETMARELSQRCQKKEGGKRHRGYREDGEKGRKKNISPGPARGKENRGERKGYIDARTKKPGDPRQVLWTIEAQKGCLTGDGGPEMGNGVPSNLGSNSMGGVIIKSLTTGGGEKEKRGRPKPKKNILLKKRTQTAHSGK